MGEAWAGLDAKRMAATPFESGLFSYASNNPIVFSDPEGRTPWAIDALSEPRNPEYQEAVAKGMLKLVEATWNAVARNLAQAIEYAPYAAQPASAPPPTPQQVETAKEGAAAVEQALTFKDVTPAQELAGAVLLTAAQMCVGSAVVATRSVPAAAKTTVAATKSGL